MKKENKCNMTVHMTCELPVPMCISKVEKKSGTAEPRKRNRSSSGVPFREVGGPGRHCP